MRLLLEIDRMSQLMEVDSRQQITPGMKFTCDGVIRKWIFGIEVQDDDESLTPEVQVWRKTGSNTYHKISATGINIPVENRGRNKRMIEYDNFQPIPIKSGDILGLFLPQSQDSRFVLMAEATDSPTNYYISTGPFRRSTLDEINVQNSMDSLPIQSYRPLVSVEIGMKV